MNTGFFVTLVVCVFAGVVDSEIVQFSPCTEVTSCTIHEVRIDPCKEAATGGACSIKRGNAASISIDFTPGFSGNTLTSRAYWVNDLIDMPFLGMNTNGCEFATCPYESGQKYTYSYNLEISKKFPTKQFDVKWKLWNEEDSECCAIVYIRLTK